MNGRSRVQVLEPRIQTSAKSGTRKRRAESTLTKPSVALTSKDCPPPPPQPRRRWRYKRRDMKRSICEPLKNISHKPGTIMYLKEGVINRAGTFLPWDTLTFSGKPLFPEPYPGPFPHVIAEDEVTPYPHTPAGPPLMSKSCDFLLDDESRVLGEEDRSLGLSLPPGPAEEMKSSVTVEEPLLLPESTETLEFDPELFMPTLPTYVKMEPEEPEHPSISWFTEAEKSLLLSLNLDSSDLNELKKEFYAHAISRSLQKQMDLFNLPLQKALTVPAFSFPSVAYPPLPLDFATLGH